jgi:hypothetical protein
MMELHSKHRGAGTILGVNVSQLERPDRSIADPPGQEGDRNSVRLYRSRPLFTAGPPLRRKA